MIQLILAAALFVWGIVTVVDGHPVWGGLLILLALLVCGATANRSDRW